MTHGNTDAFATVNEHLRRTGRMLGVSSVLTVLGSAAIICAIVIAAVVMYDLWPPRVIDDSGGALHSAAPQ